MHRASAHAYTHRHSHTDTEIQRERERETKIHTHNTQTYTHKDTHRQIHTQTTSHVMASSVSLAPQIGCCAHGPVEKWAAWSASFGAEAAAELSTDEYLRVVAVVSDLATSAWEQGVRRDREQGEGRREIEGRETHRDIETQKRRHRDRHTDIEAQTRAN